MADARKELQIVLSAQDNASAVFNRMTSRFNNFVKSSTIGSAVITGSMVVIGKNIVEVGKSYEQARVSFDTMLGSAEEGGKMLKKLSDFAVATPFDLPQVVDGAKRLLAYNIEAEKIIPTFKMLGDIAAGVGTDKLPQLILAFGQVRAATFLTGAELRQFTEAGVPLLDELAKQSGKTAGEIKESMENGAKISFKEVEKALISLTSNGGRFSNLMEKQMKTLGGVLSNVRDQFFRMSLDILGMAENGDIREGSVFYYLKIGAETFLKKLEEIRPVLQRFMDTLVTNGPLIVGILSSILAIMIPLAVSFIAMNAPLIIFASVIGLLGYAFAKLAEHIYGENGVQIVLEKLSTFVSTTLMPIFDSFRNWIDESFIPAWNKMVEGAKVYWQFIKGILLPLWEQLKAEWTIFTLKVKELTGDTEDSKKAFELLARIIVVAVVAAVIALLAVLNILMFLINEVVLPALKRVKDDFDAVSNAITRAKTETEKFFNKLKEITSKTWNVVVRSSSVSSKQHGGFVDAPYGQAVPAVLHGGERVIPRNGVDVNTGGGGGGVTLNFQGDMMLDSSDRVDELVRKITRILGRENELASKGLTV